MSGIEGQDGYNNNYENQYEFDDQFATTDILSYIVNIEISFDQQPNVVENQSSNWGVNFQQQQDKKNIQQKGAVALQQNINFAIERFPFKSILFKQNNNLLYQSLKKIYTILYFIMAYTSKNLLSNQLKRIFLDELIKYSKKAIDIEKRLKNIQGFENDRLVQFIQKDIGKIYKKIQGTNPIDQKPILLRSKDDKIKDLRIKYIRILLMRIEYSLNILLLIEDNYNQTCLQQQIEADSIMSQVCKISCGEIFQNLESTSNLDEHIIKLNNINKELNQEYQQKVYTLVKTNIENKKAFAI